MDLGKEMVSALINTLRIFLLKQGGFVCDYFSAKMAGRLLFG